MTDPYPIHEGPCVGGPLDGQAAQSRFPLGFLLVDKPAGTCWLYRWDGRQFETDGQAQPYGAGAVRAVANGALYDVLAGPWVGEDR